MKPTLWYGCAGRAVYGLQRALGLIGSGTFDTETFHTVLEFQRKNGLNADGIVGPLTWAKIDALPPSSHELAERLASAGQRAAEHLEALWKLDVFDPPIGSAHPRAKFCLDQISGIISRNGWEWALPYRGDGPPQWCGMTAGDAWLSAGLDPSWLPTYFASTYRLRLWATYQRFDQKSKANPKPDGDDLRLYVDLTKPLSVTPRIGDIIIVGDGDPEFGDHVTINTGYCNGAFDTISGNGGGVGPKGDSRQGISRRFYTIGQKGYRPMFLIRPAVRDLL